MMRSGVGVLVTLGALGCAMTVFAVPAQGYTAEFQPFTICTLEKESNELVEKDTTLLGPSNGATVTAGTAVTFSGESGVGSPLTFSVASSPALLSSPDIDSGPGSLQPGTSTYTFTSTEGAATPRTIYWDASFTRTLKDCEEPPVTFTTPARTLTVLPSPAEEQAATKKKQGEEAAARKKQEEEAEAAATGGVSLDGSTIVVQDGGEALLKLACAGTDTCSGRLTLTVRTKAKGRRKARTETIGTATFSISPGKTARVGLTLNATGRALLDADHGRLNADLTILESSPPASSQTHTENVQLVQQKAHGRTKK